MGRGRRTIHWERVRGLQGSEKGGTRPAFNSSKNAGIVYKGISVRRRAYTQPGGGRGDGEVSRLKGEKEPSRLPGRVRLPGLKVVEPSCLRGGRRTNKENHETSPWVVGQLVRGKRCYHDLGKRKNSG